MQNEVLSIVLHMCIPHCYVNVILYKTPAVSMLLTIVLFYFNRFCVQ